MVPHIKRKVFLHVPVCCGCVIDNCKCTPLSHEIYIKNLFCHTSCALIGISRRGTFPKHFTINLFSFDSLQCVFNFCLRTWFDFMMLTILAIPRITDKNWITNEQKIIIITGGLLILWIFTHSLDKS